MTFEQEFSKYDIKNLSYCIAKYFYELGEKSAAIRCSDIAHNWRDEKTGISCSHRLDIEDKIKREFHLSD